MLYIATSLFWKFIYRLCIQSYFERVSTKCNNVTWLERTLMVFKVAKIKSVN